MTVAFRSASTATNPANTDATSVTVTKPAGTVDGDLMVAVFWGPTSTTTTAPAGWVLVQGPVSDSTGISSWLYKKIAATEGASYLWSNSTLGGALGVAVSSFSGAGDLDSYSYQADPGGGTPGTNEGTTSGPQLTYGSRTCLGYHVLVHREAGGSSGTASASGVTEVFDVSQTDGGSHLIERGAAGYVDLATSLYGVGIGNFTITTSATMTYAVRWAIALTDGSQDAESWPATGIATELNLGGTWTDITSYVRAEQGITVNRGKSAQGGTTDPSTATFTLENIDGRFSPRNPNGAYYGNIGRNTPVRISKATGGYGVLTPGILANGDRLRTADTSGLQFAASNDADIRIDIQPETLRDGASAYSSNASTSGQFLVGRYTKVSGYRQWVMYLSGDGRIGLQWSDIGGSLTNQNVTSTLPVPATARLAVRATLAVASGTVTFYTSDTIAGSWTQLGTAVVVGATNLCAAPGVPQPLTIGREEPYANKAQQTLTGYDAFRGRIFAMQLYKGIGGTLVANPDFTAQTQGVHQFTDSKGLIWTSYGNAVVTNRRYRFSGEVSAWPIRWDTTGADVTVNVEAAGYVRRLQQNAPPTKSSLYRFYTGSTGFNTNVTGTNLTGPYVPKAYWPCEDGTNATAVASGLAGKPSMKVTGSPVFATYTGFQGSAAIMKVNQGSTFRGLTPGTASGQFSCEFIISAPGGITHGGVLINVSATGSISHWELAYPTTNTLTLAGFDNAGTQLFISGSLTVPIVNGLLRIAFDSTGSVYYQAQGSALWTFAGSATPSGTVGAVTAVQIGCNLDIGDVYMGHLALYDTSPVALRSSTVNSTGNNPGGSPNSDEFSAWTGESARDRAERVVTEEGFAPYCIGYGGTPLGWQTTDTIVDLLKQCEDTDGGYIYEPRDVLGLGYRSKPSIYNQPAQLTLDYSLGQLSGDLFPDEDDRYIVNDSTVTRLGGGSSARFSKTTGTLSTAAAPSGVGRYDESVNLSLSKDDQCEGEAGWRVHVGTTDEARFPQVMVALENPRIAASASLTAAVLNTDIGDRITIANPPAWMAPEVINQQVIGYTEKFDKFQHSVTFRTVSQTPFEVAAASTAATTTSFKAADNSNSTLGGTMTTTATSVTVATSTGALFTTSGTAFDIMVAGERMTVTAVTGSTSPQTFTVTRSVNGIVKAHAAGESVRLFKIRSAAL